MKEEKEKEYLVKYKSNGSNNYIFVEKTIVVEACSAKEAVEKVYKDHNYCDCYLVDVKKI